MENQKKRWIEREDKNEDPTEFYRKYYNGFGRSMLASEDFALYRILSRRGLLNIIPTMVNVERLSRSIKKAKLQASRFGKNPLAYYRKHYKGVTRGRLSRSDYALYQRLKRDGLLDSVPQSKRNFGKDALVYYQEHYDGLTSGQLRAVDKYLYRRLIRDGQMISVTSTAPRIGSDPLAYYRSHYDGVTRGRLYTADSYLYKRLRITGLLRFVPTARS